MHIPFTGYWQLLRHYLVPQRRAVLLMGVLLLGSIGMQLIGPQIASHFIDAAGSGASEQQLISLALWFIGLSIAQTVLVVLATYWSERVAWTATNALRADLVAHLIHLDMSFHQVHTPGELIERVDGDVHALAGFFSSFVVQLLGSVLLLIGVLVAMYLVDTRLGLAFLMFTITAVLLLSIVRRLGTRHWHADRQQSAAFYGYIGEVVAATEDIRSSGAATYALQCVLAHLQAWWPAKRWSGIWGQTIMTSAIALFAVADAIAFGMGSNLYLSGTISLGTVYLVIAYVAMLAAPIETIRTQLQELQRADASIVRVREVFAWQSRLVDGTLMLPSGALAVVFEEVVFGYEQAKSSERKLRGSQQFAEEQSLTIDHRLLTSDSPTKRDPQNTPFALRNIAFSLGAGQVLGVLGRTGSGKTTLARLLFRLYDPQHGTICVGGVDLRHANIAALRSRIGLVTQDVQIFAASLRDNLTFFNTEVNDTELLAVLDTLHLQTWLARLPEGLDTPISSGQLSAGEAQLIALARVFLQDPGLILLDEASARLDPVTEALIERALDQLLRNRTAIIITHRLRTIARANHILILQDGRMLEHGPHDILAADAHSTFALLARTGIEEVLT